MKQSGFTDSKEPDILLLCPIEHSENGLPVVEEQE